MTDESFPKPPRTVPHDRVVAAMEALYSPLRVSNDSQDTVATEAQGGQHE